MIQKGVEDTAFPGEVPVKGLPGDACQAAQVGDGYVVIVPLSKLPEQALLHQHLPGSRLLGLTVLIQGYPSLKTFTPPEVRVWTCSGVFVFQRLPVLGVTRSYLPRRPLGRRSF